MCALISQALPLHFQMIKNREQQKKIVSRKYREQLFDCINPKSAQHLLDYQMISPQLPQSIQRQSVWRLPSRLDRSDSILGDCEENTPVKEDSTSALQLQHSPQLSLRRSCKTDFGCTGIVEIVEKEEEEEESAKATSASPDTCPASERQ